MLTAMVGKAGSMIVDRARCRSAAFYVLHVCLFVVVSNDLWAFSYGMTLKPGFLLMAAYSIGLIIYRLWRREQWWLTGWADIPILLWAVLAVVFCIANGGIKNYAYTSAMLVYLSIVLNAKGDTFARNKLKIFDAFLVSGIIISVGGCVQFLAGLLGLGDAFFVEQWWYEGVIARVNWLMYEPSYYALVIFPFVVVTFFLSSLRVLSVWRSRMVAFLFWAAVAALILSSSRIALVACALTLPVLAILKYFYFGTIQQTWISDLGRILAFLLAVFGFFLIVEASAEQLSHSESSSVENVQSSDEIYSQSVLNGTGLGGSASHSVGMRIEALQNTIRLASQHLVVGVGLGNVGKEIAENQGVDNPSLAEAKQFEGLVPVIEITAATGVVGGVLFTGWILYVGGYGTLRKMIVTENAAIQAALSFAMLCQFALMQANQNVLRMYFWITLFVLMVFVYSNMRIDKRGAES